MKLEVDEVYLNATGEVIQIVGSYQAPLMFKDANCVEYFKDGKVKGDFREFDLIAHIPKELHHHLLSMIPLFYENPHFRKTIETKYNNFKTKP